MQIKSISRLLYIKIKVKDNFRQFPFVRNYIKCHVSITYFYILSTNIHNVLKDSVKILHQFLVVNLYLYIYIHVFIYIYIYIYIYICIHISLIYALLVQL